MDVARRAAVQAAAAVDSGAFSDVALDRALRASDVREEDRRRTTELFYGILRWQGRADWTLRAISHRALVTMDPVVKAALRCGFVEMKLLDHPAYAVVSALVQVAKELDERASGMVNAILRKLSDQGERELPRDPVEALAITESHPKWLVERWVHSIGLDRARAWCQWANQRPDLGIRVNRRRGSRDDYLASHFLPAAEKSPLSEAALALPPTPVRRLPGFADGWLSVQGIGSQVATDAVPLTPGTHVADVCCGRGTKALALLERGEGITLLAADTDRRALARIPEEAERLQVEGLDCRAMDARHPPEDVKGTFATVLVDAPCSGLGTLRRHPEIRWRRRPVDLLRNGELQEEILSGAATLVEKGGHLVYTVCTTEPEETRRVRRSFLASHEDFRSEDFPGGERGERLLVPDRDGCEGFYVALFTKKG